MTNAPGCCHWELATILASDSDSHQDARQLASNTIFNFYLFILHLFISHFLSFTRVWLDNLEPDLQKGWALTAVTEVKTAGVWARAMFNSLEKNLESDEFQSWNPKWVNSFYTSFSSLSATACRRGTAAHFHITKMKCKRTYCLPSTCILLWWALWEKLVRTLTILDSEQVLNSRQ